MPAPFSDKNKLTLSFSGFEAISATKIKGKTVQSAISQTNNSPFETLLSQNTQNISQKLHWEKNKPQANKPHENKEAKQPAKRDEKPERPEKVTGEKDVKETNSTDKKEGKQDAKATEESKNTDVNTQGEKAENSSQATASSEQAEAAAGENTPSEQETSQPQATAELAQIAIIPTVTAENETAAPVTPSQSQQPTNVAQEQTSEFLGGELTLNNTKTSEKTPPQLTSQMPQDGTTEENKPQKNETTTEGSAEGTLAENLKNQPTRELGDNSKFFNEKTNFLGGVNHAAADKKTTNNPLQNMLIEAPILASKTEITQPQNVQQTSTQKTAPHLQNAHLIPVEITSAALRGKPTMEIRMDPPELGSLKVKMEFGTGGKLKAQMVVEKPEALEALQRELPRLREALIEAGFKVEKQNLELSLQQQNKSFQQHGQEQSPNFHENTNFINEEAETSPPAKIVARGYLNTPSTRIDMMI